MIARRDLLIGAACAASLGVAEWLHPRKVLNLLGDGDLERIVPRSFGGWTSTPGGDFVVPQDGNSLAVRLYAKQLMRVYTSAERQASVMLLIAYGASQSDALQLHRPESCYPAVGLPIVHRSLTDLPVAPGVAIPGVVLTAEASQRTEDIAYWTRLGEYLPQSAGEQRRERLLTSMRGYIGDGVLVRASIVRHGDVPQYGLLTTFLAEMVRGVAAGSRKALVGSALATRLAAGG